MSELSRFVGRFVCLFVIIFSKADNRRFNECDPKLMLRRGNLKIIHSIVRLYFNSSVYAVCVCVSNLIHSNKFIIIKLHIQPVKVSVKAENKRSC